MPLGAEVGLGPGDIVLDGARLSPPKKREKRAHPKFSAHVYCDLTVGCVRIPLGTEVGLGPGDIVLDGDPVPLKGGQPSNFRPISIVLLCPNGRSATAELL